MAAASTSLATSTTKQETRASAGAPSAQRAAVRSMFFRETSHRETWQPSALSCRASPRPIPVPPPVTTVSLRSKLLTAFPRPSAWEAEC